MLLTVLERRLCARSLQIAHTARALSRSRARVTREFCGAPPPLRSVLSRLRRAPAPRASAPWPCGCGPPAALGAHVDRSIRNQFVACWTRFT
eukprot:4227996-Prymnesium_polylepis.1